MALDPNPVPGPSPLTIRREKLDGQRDTPNQQQTESKPTARDYFNAINSASRKSPIDHKHTQAAAPSRDSPPDSRPPSQPNSPHIAYQERGRQLSTDFTDQARKNLDHGSISINAITHDSPRDTTGEEVRIRGNGELQNGKFTLQEAPKKKRNSQSDAIAPSKDAVVQPASQSASAPVPANNAQVNEHQVTVPSHESPSSSRSETTLSCSPRDSQFSRSHASTDSPKSHTSPLSTQLKTLPERGDSLGKPAHGKQAVLRRETDNSKTSHAVSHPEDGYDKPASAPPTTTTQSSVLASTSGNRAAVMAQNSPSTATCADVPPPPLRARERLALQGNSSSDSFTTPRAPPKPPNTANKLHQETPSVTKSDSHNEERPGSPRLRHPIGEQPIVDEELASTVNSEGPQEPSGFLRRVSHSVRHARSHSDRGTRLSGERKWPKSPLVGSGSSSFAHEISSPTASSPESKEEIVWYKNELRRERQKTLEKEQRLVELEVALEAKTSIKQMNTELREKRSTMVVLDTQKEIVVRELEVLTEHIASAKKSDEPLDIGKLSNAVLREFAESLQKLKDSFAPQIEDLTQRRNEIMEETSNLSELKEKSFQEFEQLSLKNAQLADLNNQLVHQIQELHKVNSGPAFDVVRPSLNGLGIYTHHQKEKSNTSMDSREPRSSLADSILTGSTVVQEHEVEPATYLTAPQVVNIRKAQPKKFNWKKGGHNVAKGVTKGLKGAFSSDGNRNHREGQYPEGIPYGAMQQPSHEYPISSLPRNQVQDRREGFGGIFGNPKTRPQQWKNSSNSSFPAVNSDGGMGRYTLAPCTANVLKDPIALFGSELEQRAEYERVNIPGIVMRCIQEVDARGRCCAFSRRPVFAH